MDIKIFNPQQITATNEELQAVTKNELKAIAAEYAAFDAKVLMPYLFVEIKNKSTHFTWKSLYNYSKLGKDFKIMSKSSERHVEKPIENIGTLENKIMEIVEQPTKLQPIETQPETTEANNGEFQCCNEPEQCVKPECKIIEIEDLDKEDIKILLIQRGVDFHHKTGIKKLRTLLKETENK